MSIMLTVLTDTVMKSMNGELLFVFDIRSFLYILRAFSLIHNKTKFFIPALARNGDMGHT